MRREERNLLHDLCNWKSICRFTAILESILLASLLIGLISISEWIVVQIYRKRVDLCLRNSLLSRNFSKNVNSRKSKNLNHKNFVSCFAWSIYGTFSNCGKIISRQNEAPQKWMEFIPKPNNGQPNQKSHKFPSKTHQTQLCLVLFIAFPYFEWNSLFLPLHPGDKKEIIDNFVLEQCHFDICPFLCFVDSKLHFWIWIHFTTGYNFNTSVIPSFCGFYPKHYSKNSLFGRFHCSTQS